MRSLTCRRWLNSARNQKVTAKSGKLFEKILIANRGEIACRVIKTAKRLGIKTVAIYSEADAHSLHVEMADEALCVGPPPSSASYLNIPAILDAIRRTGAEAVHPGYGFLSENAEFCQKLEEHGVIFIGPSVEAMAKMGDKLESKRVAQQAGVSIIPGHQEALANEEEAIGVACKLGYPVMLKASAGGGGKGMRIAWNDEDIKKNFKVAAAEAQASFGDHRLLLEKYLEEPRHLEVQIVGDRHGKVIYLPERECSIQRRNQKVIEEAPSPAIDPATRRRMGEQAAQLARAVGYYSAGTVEFLLEGPGRFYFLEMNTRLQVEHPITEAITGIDLVEQMIRVAAGESLVLSQPDIKINGWALESRVYAEDPKLFLPSIGRLRRYIEPSNDEENVGSTTKTIDNQKLWEKSVRCDSGIREGSEISIYYDPLICKLSTHGPDRKTAITRMQRALDSYVIRGVTHNIPVLREVISQSRFQAGKLSTKYLGEEFPGGFDGHRLNAEEARLLAQVAAYLHDRQQTRFGWKGPAEDLWISISGENNKKDGHNEDSEQSWDLKVSQDRQMIDGVSGGNNLQIQWNACSPLLTVTDRGMQKPSLTIQFHGSPHLGSLLLQAWGTIYAVQVRTAVERQLDKFLPRHQDHTSDHLIKAPMAGRIVNVAGNEGQVVQAGGELLVIEAMKMQNVLRAPRAAKITKLHAKAGGNVTADQLLVELEFV